VRPGELATLFHRMGDDFLTYAVDEETEHTSVCPPYVGIALPGAACLTLGESVTPHLIWVVGLPVVVSIVSDWCRTNCGGCSSR